MVTSLNTAHTDFINTWLARYSNGFTKHRRAGAARTIFRRFWEEHNGPRLHQYVTRYPKPKPRNTTATEEERQALMRSARAHLQCFLMLCSDLAIRAGTAVQLGPENYDRERGMLTFRSKYESAQRLQVTPRLAVLLNRCVGEGPFVAQLLGRPICYTVIARQLQALRRSVGITRQLTAHDLRRTTARRVYELTHDMREVQALLGHADLSHTMWYLQDETKQVLGKTLELAAMPTTTEVIQ